MPFHLLATIKLCVAGPMALSPNPHYSHRIKRARGPEVGPQSGANKSREGIPGGLSHPKREPPLHKKGERSDISIKERAILSHLSHHSESEGVLG